MKKAALIVAGVLLVAIGALGVIAPKEIHVEREIVVERPKDPVFQYLKFLKNQNEWSPWEKKDPQMQKAYQGEDGTVGFISSWSGNDEVGVGEQEIKNIVEGERIETELRFKKPMEDTSMAYIATEAIGENQTKVRWGMKNSVPFPGNIFFFVLNVPAKIGQDFDDGLGQLKTTIEAK